VVTFGGIFYATALMFVAFAGYARVATMGEEVRDPKRNIPRAIVILLIITVYIAVAAVAVSAGGIEALSEATAWVRSVK
jgi:APA family basic amino acid/polyamine antiporter